MTVPDWTARASCRDYDPELWFPNQGEHAEAAKAICRRCPAITECARYAIESGADYGVFAGVRVSSDEGRMMLRRLGGVPARKVGLGACRGCARPLRDRKTRACDAPGTVRLRADAKCDTCWGTWAQVSDATRRDRAEAERIRKRRNTEAWRAREAASS